MIRRTPNCEYDAVNDAIRDIENNVIQSYKFQSWVTGVLERAKEFENDMKADAIRATGECGVDVPELTDIIQGAEALKNDKFHGKPRGG